MPCRRARVLGSACQCAPRPRLPIAGLDQALSASAGARLSPAGDRLPLTVTVYVTSATTRLIRKKGPQWWGPNYLGSFLERNFIIFDQTYFALVISRAESVSQKIRQPGRPVLRPQDGSALRQLHLRERGLSAIFARTHLLDQHRQVRL